MVIQTVLYPRKNINGKVNSLEKAKKWIIKNGYKVTYKGKKVHITQNFYRFRQAEPLTEKQKKKGAYYVTDKLRNGVHLIWMID
jgi:hypothetical protein